MQKWRFEKLFPNLTNFLIFWNLTRSVQNLKRKKFCPVGPLIVVVTVALFGVCHAS